MWLRLVRFVIVAPVQRHHRHGRAEIPLLPAPKFPRPPLYRDLKAYKLDPDPNGPGPCAPASTASSNAKPAASFSIAFSPGCISEKPNACASSTGPRSPSAPTDRKTTSVPGSPNGKSLAGPSATPAKPPATPCSACSRPAPSSMSHSIASSAIASASSDHPPSPACPSSSTLAAA